MPHTTRVLVIHSNGATSNTSHSRASVAVEDKKAYWRDRAHTVLVMIKSSDDTVVDGYEYGGAKSRDRYPRHHEILDRTGIPVLQAGGQQTMQLKPIRDRRSGKLKPETIEQCAALDAEASVRVEMVLFVHNINVQWDPVVSRYVDVG